MNEPVNNRRIVEATALRGFFQEQLDHLQRLAGEWQDRRERERDEALRIASAVESIVGATDSRIRGVGGYRKQLRSSACKLLEHIQELVAAMPSALSVDQAEVVRNPLVNRLFVSRQNVRKLFDEDSDIQAYFSSEEHSDKAYVYTLLFLHRREKNIFGTEMSGEVITKEVQQTSVAFYAHQLLGPGPSEAWVRSAMKKILFDSVIRHIKHQITELRHGQSEEEKRLGALNPERNVDNPAVYIEMLVEQLSLPRKLIKLQDELLRINKMGIKLPLDSNASSDIIRLHEVEICGAQSRIATIVRYPRCEFHASGMKGLV